MEVTIGSLVTGFPERQAAVKDQLRSNAQRDPGGFLEEAIPIINGGADHGARRYLVHLLMKQGQLLEYLIDPAMCNAGEAKTLAKSLQELGFPLETPLDERLGAALRETGAQAAIIRILDLLSSLSLGTIILQVQEELMAYPDLTVRSKAALEIVRFGKSTAWVAHLLLRGDARVQANAVEALWQSSEQNLRPVLLIAGRSPHNRVAANALLGLYKHGSLDSIPLLLRMAADPDATRRVSALWAIGETGDPRFLPYLAGEFLTAEGKEKQRIVRALSRIRTSIRAADETESVRVTVLDAQIRSDGSRRITAALYSRGEDLSSLQATRFAMWEADELITDYSTRCVASPPLLILGFAAPRFMSTANLYGQAVAQALNGLADLKRAEDPFRLERFVLIDGPNDADEPVSHLNRPEPRPLSSHRTVHRGFLTDPEFIHKTIRDPGARDAAGRDVAEAMERIVRLTVRLSGPRHIFVFFDPADISERSLARFAKSLRNEAVTLHGFAPDSENDYSQVRDVCVASLGGTFQSAPMERLPQLLAETYLGLFHRYEILYRTASGRTEAATCQLRIRTPRGAGEATVECLPSQTTSS